MSDLNIPRERTGFLEEAPGVLSSKRFFGGLALVAGLGLLVAVGVTALFQPIADASAAITAGSTLTGIGAALLGVTVLEGVRRTK